MLITTTDRRGWIAACSVAIVFVLAGAGPSEPSAAEVDAFLIRIQDADPDAATRSGSPPPGGGDDAASAMIGRKVGGFTIKSLIATETWGRLLRFRS